MFTTIRETHNVVHQTLVDNRLYFGIRRVDLIVGIGRRMLEIEALLQEIEYHIVLQNKVSRPESNVQLMQWAQYSADLDFLHRILKRIPNKNNSDLIDISADSLNKLTMLGVSAKS